MTNLAINGIEEITAFKGTRKEIYSLISKLNPMAIIDFRQAFVTIGDERYLVILKKFEGSFKVNIIWRLNDNHQFHF